MWPTVKTEPSWAAVVPVHRLFVQQISPLDITEPRVLEQIKNIGIITRKKTYNALTASKYPILGVGLRRPDGLKPFPWVDVSTLDFTLSENVPEVCPSVAITGLRSVVGGWSLLFLVEGDNEDDLVLKVSDV